MKALTVIPLQGGLRRALETCREPPESDGPVLVETLAVGVCGTDIEIVSGAYGWAPPGRGAPRPRPRVARAACSRHRPGRRWPQGDLVVGIVRRPDPVPCANCAVRRVGLLPQRPVHRARHQGARRLLLRALPDHSRLRREGRPGPRRRSACCSSRRAWWPRRGSRSTASAGGPTGSPRPCVVTGAGPIGLLAALIGVQRGLEVHVLDQVTTGSSPTWCAALGATYHTGHDRRTPARIPTSSSSAPAWPRSSSTPWSTSAPAAWSASPASRRAATPSRSTTGMLNRTMVLENEAVVGSVNANRRHYEAAAEALAAGRPRTGSSGSSPGGCRSSDWQDALDRQPDDVKVVIEVEPGVSGTALARRAHAPPRRRRPARARSRER